MTYNPSQDFSFHVMLMAIIACLCAIAQLVVFIASLKQLWCVGNQRDDDPEASKTGTQTHPGVNRRESHTASSKPPNKESVASRSPATSPTENKSRRPPRRPLHKFFRITTSLALFWFTACAIASTIDTLFYSMPFIPQEYPDGSFMLGVSANLLSYFGRITMSIVFIGRLHFVFKESSMAYNKWVIRCLYGVTFVSFVLFCLPIIIFLEVGRWGEEALQMFIISNVFDLCFSFTLVYLFVRKLRGLVALHDSGDNSRIINNMMRILSKYTVLVIVALGSTSLVIIFASFAFQTGAVIATYNAYEVAMAIDSFISGFCLYLNYPFSRKVYHKVCKHFDGCLNKVCHKL